MSRDSFSYFNHKKLIEYAGRWANRYPDGFIQKIVLYSFASPNQEHFPKRNIPTQFMVVFEVAEPRPKILSFMRKYALRFYYLKPTSSKLNFDMIFEAWEKRYGYKFNHTDFPTVLHAWEKIEKDTEQNWTIHEGYPALIHSDFEFVFNPPREPSLINWTFFIRPPNGKLPEAVKINESKLVLFSAIDNGDPLKALKIDQMQSAKAPQTKAIRKKIRKDALRVIEYREIVNRLWNIEKLELTIPEMYRRREVWDAFSGKIPALTTFRRNVSDLNPNRKPGRRQTKKVL